MAESIPVQPITALADVAISQRFDNLLILRGIACMVVIQSHLKGHVFGALPRADMILPLMPDGYEAVWLFFTLSSFLLTNAFLSGRFKADWRGTLHFYRTRTQRLLPALYVTQIGIIVLMLAGLAFFAIPKGDWLGKEIAILLAAPWIPYCDSAITSLNSPVWSVIVEIHFIVLLPLIVKRITPKVLVWLLVFWFAYIGTTIALDLPIWGGSYDSHYYNAGFFLFGMLAAVAKYRGLRINVPYILPITVISFLIVDQIGYRDLNNAMRSGAMLMAPLFCLVLLSIDTSYQKKLPTTYRQLIPQWSLKSILERLGCMSYAIYLTHKFVGLSIFFGLDGKHYIHGYGKALLALIILNAVIIAAACVLYIEVESRFRYRQRMVDAP